MRAGEIFALIWGEMNSTFVSICRPVYKGVVDSPKTGHSQRKAALSEGLLEEIEEWRQAAVTTASSARVFPSERVTPLAKENVWGTQFSRACKGPPQMSELSGYAQDLRPTKSWPQELSIEPG
jgi:hypothetical protein